MRTMKPAKSVMLMRIIRDDAKKVIMKLKGSLSEYAPIIRSMPKIMKKVEIKARDICSAHQ